MIGDGVHDRVRTESELFGVGVHIVAQSGEAAVLTVADGHHEVGPDEKHDLTGFDDL
jgi:hypothetical protein